MMRVSFDAVKGGKLKEMWVVCAARGLHSDILPPGPGEVPREVSPFAFLAARRRTPTRTSGLLVCTPIRRWSHRRWRSTTCT